MHTKLVIYKLFFLGAFLIMWPWFYGIVRFLVIESPTSPTYLSIVFAKISFSGSEHRKYYLYPLIVFLCSMIMLSWKLHKNEYKKTVIDVQQFSAILVFTAVAIIFSKDISKAISVSYWSIERGYPLDARSILRNIILIPFLIVMIKYKYKFNDLITNKGSG